jgi:CheY-like chemotaxis protein
LKFTGPGGTIRVSLRRSGELAEISVEDTGAGIDPALLPHVFDRFRQADSGPTRRHGGLGLGLAIVRQLTLLHGGTVVAASDGEGKGSRFRVSLPIAPEVPRSEALIRPASPRPLARTDIPLDLLLVEDDPTAREALGLALRSRGVRVRETASVRDALREFDRQAPTVLVSDIAMPCEDGYGLIRAIRARERRSGSRAVAIAVTGFASREDHKTAIGAGFDDHLAKPVDVDALFDRIRLLSRTRAP